MAAFGLLVAACSTSGEDAAPSATANTTMAPTTTVGATIDASGSTTTTGHPATTTLADQGSADSPLRIPVDGTGDGVMGPDSLYPGLGDPGYDIDHYAIDISLQDTGTIDAVTTIAATALEDLPVITLDFTGFKIESVAVDEADATFDRSKGKLRVTPDVAPPAGEEFIVEIAYSGTPGPVATEAIPVPVGWNTTETGIHYVIAEPDAAHSWFPSNDHPTDKATFTFRIAVPDGVVAVANGLHTESVTDVGTVTWVYEMPQPMATYLATVVIGDLHIVEDERSTAAAGIRIRNVLTSSTASAPPASLETQGEMMAHLETLFGPYPFDVYGIAVVPGFGSALENQTLSIFGEPLVNDPVFEFVLVHELAHQWFGNLVSPGDWSDIWLNEGFATYAEWLWIEHTEGAAAVTQIATGTRDRLVEAGTPPPGSPPADDLFNAGVYQRGALTLYALREKVGDEAFFATLRTYLDEFAHGTARTEDFIRIAEQTSGTGLRNLFDAWLYQKAVPEL